MQDKIIDEFEINKRTINKEIRSIKYKRNKLIKANKENDEKINTFKSSIKFNNKMKILFSVLSLLPFLGTFFGDIAAVVCVFSGFVTLTIRQIICSLVNEWNNDSYKKIKALETNNFNNLKEVKHLNSNLQNLKDKKKILLKELKELLLNSNTTTKKTVNKKEIKKANSIQNNKVEEDGLIK